MSLGYGISLTEKAKEFIVDQGYDEKFGARPLKRAIQKYIEDPLAEEIIKSTFKEGEKVSMDLNKEKDGLVVIKKKTKGAPKENSKEKDSE